ncbi:non-hydrolyzing UDP-N-acetylglucosamine 2-epimerase [uncultured Pontibacter sp.]|uniref:non-hydrolyzing UDP-N-acetylglucosamine 2-epimerase n=1 Tax=uncultured Pontibacter sp. TaxID=453356 RepID=UPI00260DEE2D|nr:UDP-N-acetylglucosamine 2-epimerase (non-hydrolyzing) [uncultured Pontibacter sp.]
MKIDLVVGTRPEAIKMAILYKQLQERGLITRLISTGQHREMLAQVFDWFEIQPDFDLEIMSHNQTLSGLSSKCIVKLQELFDTEGKSNLILVQGDTTTAFVAGLVGFYNKIKVGHIEAGLRTGNIMSPWPEEVNRKLISQFAELHFAPTQKSKEALMLENVNEANISVTGNTVIDALLFSRNKIETNNIYPIELQDFFVGDKQDNRIILITGHRRENFGSGFINICEAVNKLAELYPEVYFIYPVHLNPNVSEVVFKKLGNQPNIMLIKPLGYADFISLMMRSYIILTDSGGVQEEAPSLKKPVLVMREETEREEGVLAGVVKLVGTDANKIVKETSLLLENREAYDSYLVGENPYGNGKSCEIIAEILQNERSYSI